MLISSRYDGHFPSVVSGKKFPMEMLLPSMLMEVKIMEILDLSSILASAFSRSSSSSSAVSSRKAPPPSLSPSSTCTSIFSFQRSYWESSEVQFSFLGKNHEGEDQLEEEKTTRIESEKQIRFQYGVIRWRCVSVAHDILAFILVGKIFSRHTKKN